MPAGQLYLVGVLEGCYKIGRSGDSEKRLLSYSPKLPVTLTIHHRISTDNAEWLEGVLHRAFRHRRALGEWFRLTESDVELLKSVIALRCGESVPSALATLLELNWVASPTPAQVTAEQHPTLPSVVDVGSIAVITIGEVDYCSLKCIETGEAYTVRQGVMPEQGDFVIRLHNGRHQLRRITLTDGKQLQMVRTNGLGFSPLDSLITSQIVGIVQDFTWEHDPW